MAISPEEIIRISREKAISEGWHWSEPASVRLVRRIFGRSYWLVRSNDDSLGCNVIVKIKADTLEIISAEYLPR